MFPNLKIFCFYWPPDETLINISPLTFASFDYGTNCLNLFLVSLCLHLAYFLFFIQVTDCQFLTLKWFYAILTFKFLFFSEFHDTKLIFFNICYALNC